MKHYAQVTDGDFQEALQAATEASAQYEYDRPKNTTFGGEQNRGHKGGKNGSRANRQEPARHGKQQDGKFVSPYIYAVKCDSTKKDATVCEPHPLGRTGLEPPAAEAKKISERSNISTISLECSQHWAVLDLNQ
ncbi:MAG: hypothetical protein DRP83_02505 [Planctomycetota bacterium]|nr:MAG: hypothetical protein DRP83_02505 [Planctomycetota bacterium]